MSCSQLRGRQRAVVCAANDELLQRLLSLAAECEEAERERMGRAYQLAADSVSKCPLPITSVKEARQLVGIGDFIANRIGRMLRSKQRLTGGGDRDDAASSSSSQQQSQQPQQQQQQPQAALMQQSAGIEQKERTRSRRFTPIRGTAAYHLLLSLVLSSAPSAASSSSCPSLAVLSLFSHCCTTFRVAEKKLKEALRTLTGNGLLERSGGSVSVSVSAGSDSSAGSVRLTARGLELGQQLLAKWKAAQAGSSSPYSSSPPAPAHASPSTSPSSFPPPPAAASPPPALTLPSRHPLSGFSLTLLIDSREVAAHSHSAFSRALQSSSLRCVSRALPIGDFAFIVTDAGSGIEYTVDCIVERKRVPDLVSSIIDGRLTEQRWRMKRTGMSRRCFLIEGRDWDSAAEAAAAASASASPSSSSSVSSRRALSLPGSTLDSVVSGLSVCHGYLVVRVPSSAASLSFLRQLYARLLREMRTEGVELTEPYSAFEQRMRKRVGGAALSNEAEAESEERRKTWGSQLRMIRGVSPMIASAIVAQYGSCRSLLDAYDACDGSLRREEALLADLQFGCRHRRLGLGLSSRIRQVLRMRLYHKDEDDQEAEQRAKEEAEERSRRTAEAQEKRERKKRESEEAQRQAAGAESKAEADDGSHQQDENEEQPARRRLKSARKARELEEQRRRSMEGDQQDDEDDGEDEWRPKVQQEQEHEEQEEEKERSWERLQSEESGRHDRQSDNDLEEKHETEPHQQEEQEEVLLVEDDEDQAEQAVVAEVRQAVDEDVLLVDDDLECTAALTGRKKLTARERLKAARCEMEGMKQRLPFTSRDVVELLTDEQEEKAALWWQEAGADTVDLTCS